MVYYNKIPIYPIFYLLKGDYKILRGLGGVLMQESNVNLESECGE